jgi:hypothetical protein
MLRKVFTNSIGLNIISILVLNSNIKYKDKLIG